MSKEVILSIDQGTTGTTAAFFSTEDLSVFSVAKTEFPQIFPKPGWVEHRPDDIWKSVLEAVRSAQLSLKESHKIVAIGITNQRETTVAWNRKTGEVAGNAIVWQDRRTSEFCTSLKNNESLRKQILQKTGLVCDPYFSGSKMKWMMEHYPLCKSWAEKDELAIGTVDAFLCFQLSGKKVVATEHTNASRTMLYNLHTGDYDDELLKLFGVKRSALAEIMPSSAEFCVTENFIDVPNGTPVLGILGDQQAALFGQNCLEEGEAKITFGTGAFLLMHTGANIHIADNGLLTTAAYSKGGKRQFAFEGAAFIAGAAVQYLRDNFHWVKNSSDSEALAMQDERDPNVIFVPAFAGLGSPFWNPNAKATLFGLTRGTSSSQITRAVLESIALQNVQLLSLMEQAANLKLKRVGVDGKAALNNLLMQFQCDVLQTRLERPSNIDTTAKGAARAALATLTGTTKTKFLEKSENFEAKMSAQESKKIVALWQKAAATVDAFYKDTLTHQ